MFDKEDGPCRKGRKKWTRSGHSRVKLPRTSLGEGTEATTPDRGIACQPQYLKRKPR